MSGYWRLLTLKHKPINTYPYSDAELVNMDLVERIQPLEGGGARLLFKSTRFLDIAADFEDAIKMLVKNGERP